MKGKGFYCLKYVKARVGKCVIVVYKKVQNG